MRVNKIKRRVVTQEIFKQVHSLRDMGLTPTQIAGVLKGNLGTVYNILSKKDWEAYEANKAALLAKYGKTRTAVTGLTGDKVVSPATPLPTLPKTSKEDQLIGVLTQIANEIHLLREAWESTPKRGDSLWPFSKKASV